MQVIFLGGIVGLMFVAALVAALTGVDCLRAGVRVGCNALQNAPSYIPPTDGGGFFSTVGNIFAFLNGNVAWFFTAATAGIALPAFILAGLSLILIVIIIYLVLKLLSLGGG